MCLDCSLLFCVCVCKLVKMMSGCVNICLCIDANLSAKVLISLIVKSVVPVVVLLFHVLWTVNTSAADVMMIYVKLLVNVMKRDVLVCVHS